MNAIEKTKTLVLSLLLATSVLALCDNYIKFVEHQNLNDFFYYTDVYDFNQNEYLVKKELNLCGREYLPGDIIYKNIYESCK